MGSGNKLDHRIFLTRLHHRLVDNTRYGSDGHHSNVHNSATTIQGGIDEAEPQRTNSARTERRSIHGNMLHHGVRPNETGRMTTSA